MTFQKRLFYYLVGFSIGLIVVYVFILRDRKIDFWTPSEVIKSRIAEKPFLTTELSKCQLKCLKLYPDFVMMKVKEAKVEFKPGEEIKKQCKTYRMEHNGTIMIFKICPSDVTLEDIHLIKDTCKCQ